MDAPCLRLCAVGIGSSTLPATLQGKSGKEEQKNNNLIKGLECTEARVCDKS